MSKPDVFIIESLAFADENEEFFEGRILSEILRMIGKSPIYYYVRTYQELDAVLNRFGESQYRYLHLSCHGDQDSIDTTLDEAIRFQELGRILNPHLKSRRLFVSSCEVVNEQLAEVVMPSGCRSIAGPTEEVRFAEAAVLWTSFYHLAFLQDHRRWKGEKLRGILGDLSILLEIKLSYYWRSRSSLRGYKWEIFGSD